MIIYDNQSIGIRVVCPMFNSLLKACFIFSTIGSDWALSLPRWCVGGLKILFESPEPDLQNRWLADWFLLFISQFRQHSAFTKLMGAKYDGILKLNLLWFPKSNHWDMPSMPNGGLANYCVYLNHMCTHGAQTLAKLFGKWCFQIYIYIM